MFYRKIILFTLFLISCVSVFAQTQVYSHIDKTYAEVKEELNLTINVVSNSTNVKNPVMPSLPNFNIYSSGQSRSVSMINGKVSVNLHFNYILSPRFAGKSTIGSFAIDVDGQVYKTDPIEVEIYRSSQKQGTNKNQNTANTIAQKYRNANQNNNQKPVVISGRQNNSSKLPDFFMTASADKKSAYLNEQINLKIRFYQSNNTLGNPQYERPKMEGFIFEDIKTNEGYETKGSKQYHYIEFEMALFGILQGKATVGPAKVEYVPASGMLDPFDMFFGTAQKPQIVQTEPITIDIKPLPSEGKTDAFYGAVGTDFKIETEVDKKELAVGQTLVLTTKIFGTGNIRAIDTLPLLDLGPSFRVYDSTSSSNTKIRSGLVGGVKEFKTIIVPRSSGTFAVPPVVFQYFNPETNSYETVRSAPIPLHILPAVDNLQEDTNVQVYSAQNAPQGKRIEKISNDIYYLKNEEISSFTKVLTAIKELGKYNYLLFAVMALALLISFIRKGEFEFLSGRKAYSKARRQISKAKTINEIAPALQEYLSAKQGQPLGITTVAQSAQNLKLSSETSALLNSFWQELEMLKYAPAETTTNNLALNQSVQKALVLLKQIEKETK